MSTKHFNNAFRLSSPLNGASILRSSPPNNKTQSPYASGHSLFIGANELLAYSPLIVDEAGESDLGLESDNNNGLYYREKFPKNEDDFNNGSFRD